MGRTRPSGRGSRAPPPGWLTLRHGQSASKRRSNRLDRSAVREGCLGRLETPHGPELTRHVGPPQLPRQSTPKVPAGYPLSQAAVNREDRSMPQGRSGTSGDGEEDMPCAACWHEAGHAMVALIQNVRIVRVIAKKG